MSKTCFVIGPIGSEGTEIRKRADQVLKHLITPTVDPLDFKPLRADKISEPGIITNQVIQHIIDDPMVVADLTGANANVYYELALRHAVRKPLVQLIVKGESLPFDVAGMRTIPYDLTDPDSIEECRKEMTLQINATVGKKPGEIDSPVSSVLELQTLRKSDKVEERSLANLVSSVAELRADFARIMEQLPVTDCYPPAIPNGAIHSVVDRYAERVISTIDVIERVLVKVEKAESVENVKFLMHGVRQGAAKLRHEMAALRNAVQSDYLNDYTKNALRS